MTLKQTVIEAIKEDKGLKAELCDVFDKHFGTIERWINGNTENGPLTTVSALKIIRERTGLREEEILQPEPATV